MYIYILQFIRFPCVLCTVKLNYQNVTFLHSNMNYNKIFYNLLVPINRYYNERMWWLFNFNILLYRAGRVIIIFRFNIYHFLLLTYGNWGSYKYPITSTYLYLLNGVFMHIGYCFIYLIFGILFKNIQFWKLLIFDSRTYPRRPIKYPHPRVSTLL